MLAALISAVLPSRGFAETTPCLLDNRLKDDCSVTASEIPRRRESLLVKTWKNVLPFTLTSAHYLPPGTTDATIKTWFEKGMAIWNLNSTCLNVPYDLVEASTDMEDQLTSTGLYLQLLHRNAMTSGNGSHSLMRHHFDSNIQSTLDPSTCVIDKAHINISQNPYLTTTNQQIHWADCSNGCTATPAMRMMDMPSVFAHEYGHHLGFWHTSLFNTVMYVDGPSYESVSLTLSDCEILSVRNVYNCPQLGLLFSRAGVFADTAFCETYSEIGTDSLELVGFVDAADYPELPVRIGILPATGGMGQFAQYVLPGVSGHEVYEWRENSGQQPEVRTGPLFLGESPDDFYTRHVAPLDVNALMEAEAIVPPVFEAPPGTPTQSNCADIVVYGIDDAIVNPVYVQISTDAAPLKVRKILAPGAGSSQVDQSAQACRNAIASVVAANVAWNAYCPGNSAPCHEFPVDPGPELYIVGEAYPYQVLQGGVPVGRQAGVATAASPTWELACTGNCRSDLLIYDVDSDGVPDGPVSRVPSESAGQSALAAGAAHDVNTGANQEPSWHVALLAGKVFGAPENPVNLLNAVKARYAGIGYSGRAILEEHVYPPEPNLSTETFSARHNALSTQIGSGAREVFGFGGATWTGVVPGFFVNGYDPYANGRLAQTRRLVTWFPACALHSSWMSHYEANHSVIKKLMFGNPAKTMIAASVSQMDIGWAMNHHHMAELLAASREAAGQGGARRSVARIAYDAAIAGIAEGGETAAHAMTLSTWGSFTLVGRGGIPYPATDLTAGAGRTTAAAAWTEPYQEGDDADEYEIRYQPDTPLTESNFGSGSLYAYPPIPGSGGTTHCIELSGLSSCRSYYFAIRTRRGGAWSPISNVAVAATKCSGSTIAMCESEGLLGGSGGGEESSRIGGGAVTQGTVRGPRGLGETERSLLRGLPGTDIMDICRVDDPGPTPIVQLRQLGGRRAELDRVALGYVDCPAGMVAVPSDDSIFVGTIGPVQSVVDGGGRVVSGLREEAATWVGRAGESLVIQLAAAPGRAALVFESKHGAAVATSDSLGISVQVAGVDGEWVTLRRVYPRSDYDHFAVPMTPGAWTRLTVPREYSIRSLASMEVAEVVVPKPIPLVGARHSRLGAVDVEVRAGEERIELASADTVTVSFVTDVDRLSVPRTYFLTVEGSYEITDTRSASEAQGIMASSSATWTFALAPAYPNPGGGRIVFAYTLARPCRAELKVFDVAGRLVRTLVAADQASGPQEVAWDARDSAGREVAAGVYFYRLAAGGWHSERKVVVIQ